MPEFSAGHDAPTPHSLAEDLATVDFAEMANIHTDRTGFDGVIFVSTDMGIHGARVKWYEKKITRKGDCISVSISRDPREMHSNFDELTTNRMVPQIAAWVTKNYDDLMKWWENEDGLEPHEIEAMKARFRPVTKNDVRRAAEKLALPPEKNPTDPARPKKPTPADRKRASRAARKTKKREDVTRPPGWA